MKTFEEKFRAQYPDARLEIEPIGTCERFRLFVGNFHCSESLDRDFAFRWALADIALGTLSIPVGIEQPELFLEQA